MNIFRKIFGSKAGFKGEDPGFGKIDTDKIFPRIKPVWDDDAHELQTEKTLKIKDNDAPVYSELA
ncbi:MAG TPA: hypothetical protein VKG26_08730, partial [Bacteroidia bacterium]|nr:hypothetical protein [Bacteroidia bacterium]